MTDVLTVLREGAQAAEPKAAAGEPLALPTEPPPQAEIEAVADGLRIAGRARPPS